jgi:membrane fusion protein, multidrug efflux system
VVYDFGGIQMNNNALRVVLVAAAFAASVSAGAAGCSRPPDVAKASDADAPPISVALVAVKEVKTPRVVTLSGTLVGGEEANVAAGAAGKVIATYIERGSVVKKGAVLARLDARAVGAQAQVAAADLEALKIQAAQSKLDCDRTEKMFEKGAISKADYDRTHTQCEASKWSVSSAEARRTLTAEALKDTEIRAPFGGMVVERAVAAGEYVRPDSRICTLVDVDSLRVEITVPEADVPNVKQGMQVAFRTTTAADEAVHHGKIRYVGPSVRRQSRDAIVEAVFNNASRDLRPGMFVTARIALGEQTLPVVPAKAVRADGALKHVFVAADGRLEDRLVQAGEAQDGQIPIVTGVKPGEQVVAELTPDVRDGAKVK